MFVLKHSYMQPSFKRHTDTAHLSFLTMNLHPWERNIGKIFDLYRVMGSTAEFSKLNLGTFWGMYTS